LFPTGAMVRATAVARLSATLVAASGRQNMHKPVTRITRRNARQRAADRRAVDQVLSAPPLPRPVRQARPADGQAQAADASA